MNGDIILDHNGGAEDPDTTVIINGVNYNFIVELTGDLPVNNKVPDPLEGKQITVISVVIDGSYERLFFVTDGSGTQALMDGFGNGAIALGSADFSPPPVFICFCDGTDIMTPSGPRKVETLRVGEYVLNESGKRKKIQWIGCTDVSSATFKRFPDQRPIRIFAGSIAPKIPANDLFVSPQHRVALEGYEVELLCGTDRVFVAAKHLTSSIAERVETCEATSYYHILLNEHDVIVSNGLATESLQLSKRNLDGMSQNAKVSLCKNLKDSEIVSAFKRLDTLPSLIAREAIVLAEAMFGRLKKNSNELSSKIGYWRGNPPITNRGITPAL
ncbi:MAG TPA: hypothetical protein DIT67_10125 [Octadecabacter sp.]|nr:hypothetical protein [Octadecabacter sp.]